LVSTWISVSPSRVGPSKATVTRARAASDRLRQLQILFVHPAVLDRRARGVCRADGFERTMLANHEGGPGRVDPHKKASVQKLRSAIHRSWPDTRQHVDNSERS